MNKSVVFGVILLVVIGGGIFALSNSAGKDIAVEKMEKAEMMEKDGLVMEKREDAMMEKKDSKMMRKDEAVIMNKGDTMMKVGSYESYSAEKIAKASTGDLVLFFRASWCPTCRAVDADIKAHLKDIPADLTILDVNYDDSSLLKEKYGVTYQHTFVQVDEQGNQIKKWQGSPTLAALIAEVK